MKMPSVLECMVAECVYNSDRCCRALAITVGGPEPLCDTFLAGPGKGGYPGCSGGVGACKVATCKHNRALECTADGILVEPAAGQPQCRTFQAL